MRSKILVADDEAFIRLLIEQTLEDFEEEGVEILTAEDGEKALQVIQAERPDLVFLDVMMPKMNGFEVCETVKRSINMENIYIVMLTAKGQAFDLQRGEQVGANLYITKPFDPDELIELAHNILER